VRLFIVTVFAVLLQLFITQVEAQNPILITSSIHNRQVTASLAEPFPITTHPEADLMPALSPDGKWIAYVSRANKNYDIWVKPAAGGLATPLTTHTSDDYSPTWSPDGKSLAFISRRDDAEGDLYWLELKFGDGTITPGNTKLLKHNLQREAFPAFSPDGKKIAFSLGSTREEQIWIYEIKTQHKYPITKLGGSQPAWSRDGKQLAITSSMPNSRGQQIFVISVDSTNADRGREQITFADDNGFPSWSPDGQKILVQRFESAHSNSPQTSHLRIISLTNRAELQITPSRSEALFPFWGNDHTIYYAAPFSFLKATPDNRGNLDVWRIPESGLFPPQRTAQESFVAAQAIADPEIARLAFAALRFYFPDSTLWLSRADLEMGRRYLRLGDSLRAETIWAQVAKEYAGRFEAAAFAEIELAKLARDTKRLGEISERSAAWPAAQAFGMLETGKALQNAGAFEAALQCLQKIPTQYPDLQEVCYEALLRAGDIYTMLDRAELGEAAYLQIVTAYREHEDWQATTVQRLLDATLRRALAGDTLAIYQRAAQKFSAHPAVTHAARFRMAERLFRDGEIKLAENEYQNLIGLLENQSEPFLQTLRAQALRGLMRLHIHENDFPPAVQVYGNLFEAYSNPPEKNAVQEARQELTTALIQRARLLVRRRDYELALALFRQARRFDPQNVEAHRGYVEALQALGDIDDAIGEYEKANPAFARFAPTANEASAPNEVALYALGLAYSYKGENNLGWLRHSTALIERALRINYQLIPAYLTLGFNYEAIEKLEQKARQRKKGFFAKSALAAPGIIDKIFRTITLRPPKPRARWYEKAIEVLTSALAFNDEKNNPQLEANIALNLANNYYNIRERGDIAFDYALQYFQYKLRYDSTFVSQRQQAVIFERIGECAWATRRYDEAIPFLQTALKLCRERRDVDGELRNLNRLALVYQDKGDYETSNEQFAKVDTVNRRENRRDNLALVWRNMALNHQQNKESDEAITKSVRSSRWLEQRGKSTFPAEKKERLLIKIFDVVPIFWMTIDPFGESNTDGLTYEQEKALLFSIIGESYVAAKDFANAIAVFEKKAAAFRQKKNLAGEARALNNLGALWYSYHDFIKAYDYFTRSFNLCARLQTPAGKIINVINMGNIALLTGDAGRAHAIDSLLQAGKSDIEQIGLQAPRQKLAVMNTLGNLYLHAAQNLFSAPVRAAFAPPTGSANNGLGGDIERSYRALQNLGRAQAAYDTALAVAQSQRLPRDEVIVRRNLASLFLLSRDYALALEQLQTAHAICIAKNFSDLIWRVKHALGTLRRFVYVPPQSPFAGKSALEWYRGAIQILEGLPEEPEGSEQRLAETAEQNALYENAVMLLAEQEQPRAALELAERSRSNRFISLISTRYILPKKERQRLYWGGAGGLALDVQRQLSRLRGELARLEAAEPPRPKEIKRTREALATAAREYRSIVQEALAEDPEFASFFSIQTVDTQALQDSLDPETAILEYFVAENELIVWLLSRERLEQIRVPIARQRLQELVASLRESWLGRRAGGETLCRELSTLLLGGVRDLDSFHRLMIVPDDCLHYLPFSALEYGGERLLDLFAVGKIPSLLALNFAARHQNLNENNLLVVQDAREDKKDKNDNQQKSKKIGDNLVAANDTGHWLADSLAQRIPGLKIQQLRGADWRADEVRQRLQQAGLLHVQNHFAAQPQRPLDSGFLLQLTASDTALFPLYRLFEFDLSASLVALENTNFPFAPERARKGLAAGDELVALQRSLIYAGTPTLVYSQWPVAPKIREIFFAAFYKNLSSQPAIAALHAAQDAVREQFPDPGDWAGFELIGFPGMSVTEKSAFADRHFKKTVRSGNESQELGEFRDAVRYYQTALTMAQQLGDEEARQNLYLLIKASALSGGDYATACEVETKILEGALAANDIRQIAQSYRNLSTWQTRLKNYAAALEVEKKYLELAERVKNPLAIADSRLQQARILEAAGDYAAAMAQAEQAVEILQQQNQMVPRFQAETFLGKLALEDDQYAGALNYLEKATRHFLETRQPANPAEQRLLATAYQLTGSVYSRLTAYGEALKFHQQALQIFAALADTANLTLAEQNLADACWFNGDYQTALLHQQRALRLADDPREKLRGQSTLGLILLSLGDPDGALDAEKRALQFALETEEPREQATIHKNLGLVYVQRQEHQQALASWIGKLVSSAACCMIIFFSARLFRRWRNRIRRWPILPKLNRSR